MPLREELASGSLGLRWAPPQSLEWMENDERIASARDRDRRVAWLIRSFPWRLDLRPAFDVDLRADLKCETRAIFAANAEEAGAAPGAQTPQNPPRTDDPEWSPIVELERVQLGKVEALRLVWRMDYRPGKESVGAALLVPLAAGYVEITAVASTNRTGYRESMVMLSSPGDPDAPEHDQTFADHPLSVVRAALRWLLEDSGLRVLKSDIEPVGEVILEAAGCAVVPPPRYLLVPEGLLRMSPSLVNFALVSLGDAPVRLLDVWRLPERIAGADRERQLLALAKQIIADWAKEGATDVRQAPKLVPSDGTSKAEDRRAGLALAMSGRADDLDRITSLRVGASPWEFRTVSVQLLRAGHAREAIFDAFSRAADRDGSRAAVANLARFALDHGLAVRAAATARAVAAGEVELLGSHLLLAMDEGRDDAWFDEVASAQSSPSERDLVHIVQATAAAEHHLDAKTAGRVADALDLWTRHWRTLMNDQGVVTT